MFKYILKTNIKMLPITLVVIGSFSVFGAEKKSKIEKLTSKENSKEVSSSAAAAPAMTGSLNRHSFGIAIGQTFLNGDFKDNGEDKITPEIYYNYSASHSFDLLVNFHISEHDYRDYFTRTTGLAIGIKSKLYQFDNFAPFAVGGLGFYSPKMRRDVNGSTIESESKLTFGYHLGVGGELKLNNHYSMGFIGHYHNPFDVKQDVGPEVEGSYFKLLLTGFYTF